MIAVLSLLLVATLFVTVARVATIALVGTGMASDVAGFQARSALMGVGYTTTESEHVITHPPEEQTNVETGCRDVLDQRLCIRAVFAVTVCRDGTFTSCIGH